MKLCNDIAMADEVLVRLTWQHPYVPATVEDYDEELEEFLVLVRGAWRLNQRWWVPCENILLD